jgi:hypothetical protein
MTFDIYGLTDDEAAPYVKRNKSKHQAARYKFLPQTSKCMNLLHIQYSEETIYRIR